MPPSIHPGVTEATVSREICYWNGILDQHLSKHYRFFFSNSQEACAFASCSKEEKEKSSEPLNSCSKMASMTVGQTACVAHLERVNQIPPLLPHWVSNSEILLVRVTTRQNWWVLSWTIAEQFRLDILQDGRVTFRLETSEIQNHLHNFILDLCEVMSCIPDPNN